MAFNGIYIEPLLEHHKTSFGDWGVISSKRSRVIYKNFMDTFLSGHPVKHLIMISKNLCPNNDHHCFKIFQSRFFYRMASVVLTMNSPHDGQQQSSSSPIIFKKKTRRAPKKQKKNKKPYFKLSWKEKEEANEKDRIKGEARLANSKISAPNNTTQFLMQEHPTSTPNQTPVGMSYDSDDDDYNSVSSDDIQGNLESPGVFMENDFAETFENMKADILETKTRSQLISEIVSLEKAVNELVKENGKVRHNSNDTNAELMSQLSELRKENEMLKAENLLLKEGKVNNKSVSVTPVKDNMVSLDVDDNSNASLT